MVLLVDFLLFNEVPDALEAIGIIVIVFSITFTAPSFVPAVGIVRMF